MPKPQAEPRFNKLWRSLDRALAMAGFDAHEQMIMQIARELSYTASIIDGSGRAKAFRINATIMAERRDTNRESLSRALGRLLESNVLTGDRGQLRINKKYRSWTGRHALTPIQIIESDNADTELSNPCGESFDSQPKSPKAPDLTTQKRDSNVTPTVTETSQCTKYSVTETSQKRDSNVTPTVTETSHRIVGTRPSEELIQSRERESYAGEPNPEQDQHKSVSSTPDVPSKIAALIVERCDDEENREYYQAEARRWVEARHTESAMKAALLAAAGAGATGMGLIRYATKILDSEAVRASRPPSRASPRPLSKPAPTMTPTVAPPEYAAMIRNHERKRRET